MFFWGYMSILFHKKYPHRAMKVEERAVLHLLDEETGKANFKWFVSTSLVIWLTLIFIEGLVNQLEIVAISFSLLSTVLAIIAFSIGLKIYFSRLSEKKLLKQTGILYVPEEKVFFELEKNGFFFQLFISGFLILSLMRLTSQNLNNNDHGYGLICLILSLGLLLGVNRGSIPPREGQMDFADVNGQKKKMMYWDEVEK